MQSRTPSSSATAVYAVLVCLTPLLVNTAAAAPGGEKVIHTFAYNKLGATPIAPLIFDSAGNLYGTAGAGGRNNLGTVFELSPKSGGGWAERVLHTFSGTDGADPYAGLVLDATGDLYGTTSQGGAVGHGTVFELTPTTGGGWTESVLYDFMGGSDGDFPTASLILDSQGDLYGTTFDGGMGCGGQGCGTIFELVPANGRWTKNVLYTFTGGNDGGYAYAGLLFDAAGNLYGTTVNGGQSGRGTVYMLSPANGGWTEHVLYSFAGGNDGGYPYAGLILDAAGDLYGTTGNSIVFELTPQGGGTWTKSVLYSFGGINSESYLLAGLIFDQAGSLYGATYTGGDNKFCSGCGVVFELTPTKNSPWTETTIHSFTGKDGSNPYASLVFDPVGNLYGSTGSGGPSGNGTVFELTHKSGGWSEKVLSAFQDVDGQNSRTNLIMDGAGNLYGTTENGGKDNFGTVFELMPVASGWKEKLLYSFKSGKDGSAPTSGLIFDSAGNLYGVTASGGAHRGGTIFELSPVSGGGWKKTILHSFVGSGGMNPNSGLVFDGMNNLYGTTTYGGSKGGGTVFELKYSKGRWAEVVLHSFCSHKCGDGDLPLAGVTFDAAGDIFGTTERGGSDNVGTVFELTPKHGGVWTESVLYSFRGETDGEFPGAELVFDATGNLYGTTIYGGASALGTVFMLAPTGNGGWAESVIYNFTGGVDGEYPYAGLVLDSTGNLYGTTVNGGLGSCGGIGCGSLFELLPSGGTWVENTVLDFTGESDGGSPYASLIFDAAGNLYGTTSQGGVGVPGAGVVFEITP